MKEETTLYGLRVSKALIDGLRKNMTYEELKALREEIRQLMQQRLDGHTKAEQK